MTLLLKAENKSVWLDIFLFPTAETWACAFKEIWTRFAILCAYTVQVQGRLLCPAVARFPAVAGSGPVTAARSVGPRPPLADAPRGPGYLLGRSRPAAHSHPPAGRSYIFIPRTAAFRKLMLLPNDRGWVRRTAAEEWQYKASDIRKQFVIIKVPVNLHSFK